MLFLCYDADAERKLRIRKRRTKEMKIKRILSILLCVASIIAVMPLSAFANGNNEPYAEIKFRNPETKTIEFGKTEEIYLDYSTGEIETCKIEWSVSKNNRCKIEYVTDEETGLVTGAKLTGKNFGDLTFTARLFDESGNEIVSANKTVRVVESKGEDKTLEEKLKIILQDSYLTLGMTIMYVPFLSGFVILIMGPYYTYLTIKTLVFG